MARKSKPWAVIVSTPGGPYRTEHSSQKKAYEKVLAERDAILAGTSRGYKVRVEQWEHDCNRWVWFDQPYPEGP
jgi:hypothetical protein